MLSHLRFHRRGPSNPSSPSADSTAPPPPWSVSSVAVADCSLNSQQQQQQLQQHPQLQYQPHQNMSSPRGPTPADSVPFFVLPPTMASEGRPRSENLPPILPPIPRVTSGDSDDLGLGFDVCGLADAPQFESDSQSAPAQPRSATLPVEGRIVKGFIGGVALEKARQNAVWRGEGEYPDPSRRSHSLSPIQTTAATSSYPSRNPPKTTTPSSFVPPTEFQQPLPGLVTGLRPPGKRMAAQPPLLSITTSNNGSPSGSDSQQPRPKRAFLKNPVSSLLMRRKANQNAPDLSPLPLADKHDEPAYDPRIRGTRVHDFSAPRPRRVVTSAADARKFEAQTGVFDATGQESQTSVAGSRTSEARQPQEVTPRPVYELEAIPAGGAAPETSTCTSTLPSASTTAASTPQYGLSASPSGRTCRSLSADRAEERFFKHPIRPDDPVTPAEEAPSTAKPTASVRSRQQPTGFPTPSRGASARSSKYPSRKVSLAGGPGRDAFSSVPRHMKSTSSRFSFDMIGAAKQERLLEERHRQRELERKSNMTDAASHDPAFDDFDEEFDYDAMMDDGGLEERIPGVNADYEEEGGHGALDDPDNDQENFAGFAFSRSHPSSAMPTLHSVGMMATPRDVEGRVTCLAMSKDTPDLHANDAPALPPNPADPAVIASPGTRGSESVSSPMQPMQPLQPMQPMQPMQQPVGQRPPAGLDGFDFNDGMIDFADEFAGEVGDGSTFDESLFDLDDTDQYGRPLPGAFAAAKSQMMAANSKRRPEPSRLSRRPVPDSQSAAHASAGNTQQHAAAGVREPPHETESDHKLGPQPGPQPEPQPEFRPGLQPEPQPEPQPESRPELQAELRPELQPEPQPESQPELQSEPQPEPQPELQPETQPPPTRPDSVAAYQAALAAAAHMAAASGKFRRDSSPSTPTERMHPAMEDAADSAPGDHDGASYDYDDCARPLDDDYDEDDDIISEANATALANDSDGWYGREFNFYSAPAGQPHASGKPSYGPSNGGYFVPASSVHRTKSGRFVSREPNLTPITERSEYSNRNSIMSLGIPAGGGGLYSPGIPPRSMMGEYEDDPDLALSALLRFRNRAWGGSQASVPNSRDGSPKSEHGSPSGPAVPSGLGHARKSSSFSARSRSEDGSESGQTSPTLRLSMPSLGSPVRLASAGGGSSNGGGGGGGNNYGNTTPSNTNTSSAMPAVPPPPSGLKDESREITATDFATGILTPNRARSSALATGPDGIPTRSQQVRRSSAPGMVGRGHRYKGPGDSISYRREGEAGETRWVMERVRRTGGDAVEVLGTEVVDGI